MEWQGLKRDVAVSVTHFLAIPEMVVVSDYCATLPHLICKHLTNDKRLKVLPAPVDLGTLPVQMGWHARYRNDPAHRWLRGVVAEVAGRFRRSDYVDKLCGSLSSIGACVWSPPSSANAPGSIARGQPACTSA